jgi:hypothetical protein
MTRSVKRGMRERQGMGLVLLVVLALLGLPSAVSAQDYQFRLQVGDCAFSGTGPPGAELRVVVADVDDHRKARVDVVVNDGGNWRTDCLPGLRIQPRDHVEVRRNGTLQRLFAIPRFSLIIDRAADRARGRGPSGEDVALSLDRCIPGEPTCYGNDLEQTIHVGGDGSFDVRLRDDGASTGYDAVGGAHLRFEWMSGQGDLVLLRGTVSKMQATLGAPKVTGFARPGQQVRLTLRSKAGGVRAAASVVADSGTGAWTTRLLRAGRPVSVQIGDRLSGSFADDAQLKVRSIEAQVDLGADNVQGSCYPSGMVGLQLQERGGGDTAVAWGESGPNGSYGPLNVNGFESVTPGWIVHLFCGTGANDVLHRHSVVP